MLIFRKLFSSCLLVLALTLAAGAAQAQLPDVQITRLELDPYNPVAGQEVDFTVTIYNAGPGETPKKVPVGVGVQVDGTFTGSYFVRSAGQNGPTDIRTMPPSWPYTWRVSPRWVATSGTHQVCAIADDVNRFPEIDENNNSLCVTVTVPDTTGEPDVIVPAIQMNQAIPGPGEPLRLLVYVRNIGSAATPTGVPVGTGIQVDGVHLTSFFERDGSGQVKTLGPGELGGRFIEWTTVVGTHEICAITDDIDRFAEADDNNNTTCLTVDILPTLLPDTFVTQLYSIPPDPIAGQTVQLSAWVENDGNADTPVGVPVGTGFQANGAHIGSEFVRVGGSISNLQSGQIILTPIDWVATSGSHYICAIVDDIDRFLESNENNNSSCMWIHVP